MTPTRAHRPTRRNARIPGRNSRAACIVNGTGSGRLGISTYGGPRPCFGRYRDALIDNLDDLLAPFGAWWGEFQVAEQVGAFGVVDDPVACSSRV